MTLSGKLYRFCSLNIELFKTDTIQCVETRTVPEVELPTGLDVPKNQSKVEKPSKEELLKKHQTRLKHKNL